MVVIGRFHSLERKFTVGFPPAQVAERVDHMHRSFDKFLLFAGKVRTGSVVCKDFVIHVSFEMIHQWCHHDHVAMHARPVFCVASPIVPAPKREHGAFYFLLIHGSNEAVLTMR